MKICIIELSKKDWNHNDLIDSLNDSFKNINLLNLQLENILLKWKQMDITFCYYKLIKKWIRERETSNI